MNRRLDLANPGIQAALISALLFGAGTPIAKLLLGQVSPWMLAGLLYLASGLALWLWRLLTHADRVRLQRQEWLPLGGAIFFGGMLGPLLLMLGLQNMPASGASLLLNADGIFTALIAWIVFRENAGPRIVAGFAAIAVGAVILSWPGQASFSGFLPAAAILGACLSWAIDNNLTRKVALTDAVWLAMIKGLVAGPVNLMLALALGAEIPTGWPLLGGALVGVLSYGISLALFIVGMRYIGTARAGAYFSIAPFFGTVLALLLGEQITWQIVAAGLLMAFGIWLHLTERHEHEHAHEPTTHSHWHTHDEHHQHEHRSPTGEVIEVPAGTRHRHEHQHSSMVHSHPHYPDAHHQHSH